MIAYLFGLLSYLGWGTGDIFGAIAARKIGGFQSGFWVMTGAAILFMPLAFLYRQLLFSTPFPVVLLAFLSGFLYQSGNFAVSVALVESDVSIVLTIMGTFGALIVLFSTLFLHEPITLIETGIITAIFSGVFLCTYKPGAKLDRRHMRGVWLALYAAVSFGLFFTILKTFTATLSWFWPLYLSFLWLPIFYLWFRQVRIPISIVAFRKARVPVIASLLLLRGGDLVFNVGLQKGLSLIVAPIGGASPTLSVILAFLVFHEKPTRRQLAGIILALTGIVALAFVGR